jgi:hypothetical protein
MPVFILKKRQQRSYQWMEHWQVLTLKVAGFWSENAQRYDLSGIE